MTGVSIVGWIFTLLGLCGAGYALLAAFFAGRFARRQSAAASDHPPVTVLKPLYGAELALRQNLETFFRQDYRGRVQLVFGVHDRSDAAVPVVEALRKTYPRADVVLVSESRRHGTNPKISNLIGMQAAAAHDVLVLSDSDIAVPPDYLATIAATLAPDGVGAVTCVYTGWAAAGFASRISAMGVSYQFLPNVIVGVALGFARPCFGSTIAIKAPVLEAVGGFRAFASVLADDYEIGRAVREKGLSVAIPNPAVRHACSEASLAGWFRHELRWMRTIRTVDPAGHWGSFITHAVPVSLLGAILTGFSAIPLGVLGASIAARAMLKWRIDSFFGGEAGPAWLLPLRDVLSFGVFLASLAGTSVVWQNHHLQVRDSGMLSKR